MEKAMYQATHDETGMVLTGDVNDLAERLGIAINTVYKVAIEGRKALGHWEIERLGESKKYNSYYKMPDDLRKKWDEVTKPFKAASRRAGGLNA